MLRCGLTELAARQDRWRWSGNCGSHAPGQGGDHDCDINSFCQRRRRRHYRTDRNIGCCGEFFGPNTRSALYSFSGPVTGSPESCRSVTSFAPCPHAGATVLQEPVGQSMTRNVVTCGKDDPIASVMERMTKANSATCRWSSRAS